MSTGAHASRFGLVPLADRILWSTALRGGIAVTVLGLWVALSHDRNVSARTMVALLAVYGIVAALVALAPRVGRTASIVAVNAALVADGIFLGGTLYALGGVDALSGPVSMLVVVHVSAVSLLTSFRSGVKVAAWDSLVVLCVLEADRYQFANRLPADVVTPAFPYRAYGAMIAVVWLAAIATSTFAAVNERELRRRRYDAEVLHDLAVSLEAVDDPEEIARQLAVLSGKELLASRALVIVRPRTHSREAPLGSLQHRWPTPLPRSSPAPQSAPGYSLLARANRTGKPVLVSHLDPTADAWLMELLPQAHGVVALPLPLDSRADGWLVLELGSTRGGVERRLLSTALQAASHAGLALIRAGLVEQLRQAAQTDGLTGAANRRAFDEALAREVSRAARTQAPLAVAMVDLDYFKSINDTHGHQAGDEALKAAARSLLGNVRGADTVARYGGEEFAVILPDTGRTAALETAERLRAAVTASATAFPLTCSIGVAVLLPAQRSASLPAAGTSAGRSDDAHTLVATADRALYAAKRNGRNRCELAPLIPAPRGAREMTPEQR